MIVLLGCLLLLIAFRSLLVPAVAAVMNLLAAGAAFGVVTQVFQHGFLADTLGVGQGPVEAFLPVMMLAILFGLSMDYQVFLVSRMHEEWQLTRNSAHSVSIGQAATGRVIMAAATIMVFVFLSFLLGGERVIAELYRVKSDYTGASQWLDRALPHVAVEPAGARARTLSGMPSLAALQEDPHPVLHELRARAPVAWVEALGGWVVLTRELCLRVMRDAATFTVDDPRFSTARVVGPSMLSTDGEEHARHRAPFARAVPARPGARGARTGRGDGDRPAAGRDRRGRRRPTCGRRSPGRWRRP